MTAMRHKLQSGLQHKQEFSESIILMDSGTISPSQVALEVVED